MENLIGRSAAESQRIFPPLTPNLYQFDSQNSELTPDQRAARKLLDRGKQNFRPWEGLKNRHPDSATCAGRLLFNHRMAMQEELDGQFARADFFWHEFYQALRGLQEKPEFWDEVSQGISTEPGVVEMSAPEKVRQRLITEVFIDTHCAFYNGRVLQAEPITSDSRVLLHFGHLAQLVGWAQLHGEELRGIIGPPAELQIELCRKTGQWDRGIDAARLLVNHFPDSVDYQDKLAGLYFSSTLDGLSDTTSESQSLRDANKVQKGLERLQELFVAHPENLTVYELLGHLHHLRAIKLANGRQLSDALLEVQKAVTIYPTSIVFNETRGQLIEAMKNLRTRIDQVEQEIAGQYNATLSAEGQLLQREARRGFGAMNEYAESQEAKQIYDRFLIANAHQLWRTIGLEVPINDEKTGDWDDQSLRLFNAVTHVLNQSPATGSDIAAQWQALSQKDIFLASLDAEVIGAFLQDRLFGSEEEQKNEAESKSVDKTYVPPADPIILTTAPRRGRKSGEPVAYWLFSRQDTKLKVFAAAAAVILCLAATLWLRDVWYRRTRDSAFRVIVASKEQEQHLNTIEAAEAFLSHPPLTGSDGRENKVIRYYQEAILHWVTDQNGVGNPALTSHLNRYRQLVAQTN